MQAEANPGAAASSSDRSVPAAAEQRIVAASAVLGAIGLALTALWLAFHGGGTTLDRIAPAGVAVATGLLALSLSGGFGEASPRRWHGWIAAGAALGLAGFAALSVTWTESPTLTVNSTALWTFAALVLIGSLIIFRGRGAALGIAVVVVVPLVIALVIDWHLLQGREGVFAYSRLSYPLDYANGAAALVFIGVPAAVGLAALARIDAAARAALAAAASVMISTGALAISRGGTLALVLSLVVVFLLARARIPVLLMVVAQAMGFASAYPLLFGPENRSGFIQRGLGILLGAVVAAAVGLGATVLEAPANRAWSRFGVRAVTVGSIVIVMAVGALELGHSLPRVVSDFRKPPATSGGTLKDQQSRFNTARSNRWSYWKVAIRSWRTHPIAGIGAGTFAIPWYRERAIPESTTDPHGWPFKLASEEGAIGTGLFLLLAGALVAAALNCRRRAGPGAVLGVAAAGSTTYFLAHAGVDWLFSMASVVVIGMTAAGVLAGAAAGSPRRLAGVRFHGSVGLVALLALAVLVPLWISLSYQARAERQLDPRAASQSLRVARNWNPFSVEPLQVQAQIDDEAGRAANAEADLRKAIREEPQRWELWAELAQVLAGHGKTAQAAAAARHARTLNPLQPALSGS